jgi:hypothetical protein
MVAVMTATAQNQELICDVREQRGNAVNATVFIDTQRANFAGRKVRTIVANPRFDLATREYGLQRVSNRGKLPQCCKDQHEKRAVENTNFLPRNGQRPDGFRAN